LPRRKPSVIQIRADLLTPVAIGSAVLRAIAQTQRELTEGALISIDLDRARVRILPLGS
jgi:predicted nuclease of predicted toxin-antitoxin system